MHDGWKTEFLSVKYKYSPESLSFLPFLPRPPPLIPSQSPPPLGPLLSFTVWESPDFSLIRLVHPVNGSGPPCTVSLTSEPIPVVCGGVVSLVCEFRRLSNNLN